MNFSDAAKIGRVSLIRLGSVTHSLNMDERMLSLAFSQHSNLVATTSTPQVHMTTPESTTNMSAAETTQEATITTSLPDTTTPESTPD